MTVFILFIASHPGNNLFMMGLKSGPIKVEAIVTVILWTRKDECIELKEGKKEVEKRKIYKYSEYCTNVHMSVS